MTSNSFNVQKLSSDYMIVDGEISVGEIQARSVKSTILTVPSLGRDPTIKGRVDMYSSQTREEDFKTPLTLYSIPESISLPVYFTNVASVSKTFDVDFDMK
mmetsp:Transcript_2832/g.2652  ORF Transcript_2832/g.2652 Transcript_2832/m.2652 type:complete len:101 (+) Transcript_2832:92-394(+)|eukprot:CAMPEP_0170562682 /NCGR_PEP_ID=MMETSP0211-20121228/61922_1 /TAXON_ID=311385 /ORGANISM="Pseudokeronopsis sp., Strain OXSARD2" /LENGTH=100 /DNA_ID=CAMNT_0010879885 /DNA_START=35 /DNA_END=337 /DNA_ORIENTATION=+